MDLEQTSKPASTNQTGLPLTDDIALLFFSQIEEGATITQACRTAGIARPTAYKLLARYDAQVDGVKKLLAAKAMQAAEDWIKASTVASGKGNHVPAKELLQTIRAVEPIESSHSGNLGVTIVIGTPEHPIRITAQNQDLSPTEIDTHSETLEIRPNKL